MVAPLCKLYGKTQRGFILKPTERAQVLLRNGTRDFQNSPLFQRSACFYMTISGSLNIFNVVTLKHIFWKTKTFFKKLEYGFLVESNRVENASFPYKSVISKANVKTNRMISTKQTYHKELSFASNYLIFLKISFHL